MRIGPASLFNISRSFDHTNLHNNQPDIGSMYSIVRALNKLFTRLNAFLQLLDRNFVVFNSQRDPKCLDIETYSLLILIPIVFLGLTDRNMHTLPPNETVLRNRTNIGFKSLHICLIIPRLNLLN